MANGGKRQGAGRPKGSHNKATADAVRFVERVEKRLIANGKPHGLETIAKELLESDDLKVAGMVWKVLMEYRYGKPKESIEHSGQVATVIWDIPRPERERT